MRQLPRSFYARPAEVVARELLNKVVTTGSMSARIVETEAYGGEDDPASHGHRRRTDRNAVMFGRPGLLYVYFTYGMHYCVCPVTGANGESSAVLIRAAQPLSGQATMRERRVKAKREVDLTNGPAKFAQAFDLTTDDDGIDLCDPSGRLLIMDDGTPTPDIPGVSTRVGLTKAVDTMWRWWVPDDPAVSNGRPSRAGDAKHRS